MGLSFDELGEAPMVMVSTPASGCMDMSLNPVLKGTRKNV